jgi:hypothetical protein
MTVTFELTPEESNSLQQAANARAQRLYGPAWISKLHWYGLMPVTIVAIAVSVDQPAVPVICFVIFRSLNYCSNFFYQKLFLKNLREANSAVEARMWTVSVGDEDLALKTELYEHRYRWKSFHGIDQTENYIYVRATPTHRVVIPKRAFVSPEAMASFIAELTRKIPNPTEHRAQL